MSSKSLAADNRVQFTLRLPPDIHAKLVERAGSLSLNVFIVQKLQEALTDEEKAGLAEVALEEALRQKQEAARQIELMAASIKPLVELREEAWQAGFAEGRKQLMEEIGAIVDRSVRTAVRETLGNPSGDKP